MSDIHRGILVLFAAIGFVTPPPSRGMPLPGNSALRHRSHGVFIC